MQRISEIAPSGAYPAMSKKKSILVIDDQFDALTLQRIILEMNGFEVFTAQSGTKAFEILKEISPPNLILLDMRMEDMTGSDFLDILQETRPEIAKTVPIVFLTAYDRVPPSIAAGFIRKPAEMDQFLGAVQGFLEMGQQPPYRE